LRIFAKLPRLMPAAAAAAAAVAACKVSKTTTVSVCHDQGGNSEIEVLARAARKL
jgi:hypothetical protein